MSANFLKNIVGLAVLLTACGSPGAYDLCRAQCAGTQRCGYRNDSQVAGCNSSCDANQTSYTAQDMSLQAMCQNWDSMRRQQLSCIDNAPCGASSGEYLQTLTKCTANTAGGVCIKP